MAYQGITPSNSVAPKVQSTNMAPRQEALQRRMKPKDPTAAPWKTPKWAQGKTATITGSKSGQVTGPSVAPKQPAVQNDDIDKYLAGDDVYQSVLASLDKNKQLNASNYDYNVQNYQADNDTIKKRLTDQEKKDNSLLDNDYAARGMFGSGLFAKADADLGQSYFDQGEDLALSLKRNLHQLMVDQNSQTSLDEETRRQAELDAITRRAQEFGIFGGPSIMTEQPNKPKGDKKKPKGKGKK